MIPQQITRIVDQLPNGGLHMSENITDTIKTSYDAFEKGNLDPLMSLLADNVRWHVSGGSPLAGDYIGKAEVLEFFGKMMQLYGGSLRLQVVDILASEKHAAVLIREEIPCQARALTCRSVHLWEVRNATFSAFHVYYDDAYHKCWPVHEQGSRSEDLCKHHAVNFRRFFSIDSSKAKF